MSFNMYVLQLVRTFFFTRVPESRSLAANSFSIAASQSGWSGWNGWPLRKSNPKASIPVSQSRVQTVDVQPVRSVRSEVIDEDTIENSQI